MKPAAFAYAKAFSLDHAIELLGGASAEARVLAGGQSLIATLNMRLSSPDLLVDINAVPGLDGIAVKDGMLEIGALVRHAQAERSDVVARHAPLIAMALPHIGHAAIRNRGTVGGSIAFADPAAELPACLVALGGEVSLAGPDGRRSVAAAQFFRGLFETALWPHRRGWRARPCATPAWSISGSAQRRCARATPKPRWPQIRCELLPQPPRSRGTSIRPTTCRRAPR